LSDAIRLSSKDAKGWLEKETESKFVPVHSKAEKLLGDMNRALEDLQEISQTLLENSAKEIEKRNMKTHGRARALNKLARLFVDRMRQLRIPTQISYDSFSQFVQQTQRAFLVTDVDVRNWFPRISPFFILDRRKFTVVFEKTKGSLRDLNNFLAKEYANAKKLEETFQQLNKLQTLETRLTALKEQRLHAEAGRASVEREITEKQNEIDKLKAGGSTSQLDQTSSEINTLSTELKHSLQHLQKPLAKLQSLATHSEGSGLTPQEFEKLTQYLTDPFGAFSTEEPDCPLLGQILRKLDSLILGDKLKLKPEKARKARQSIGETLTKDSLKTLHQRCTKALAGKAELATSTQFASEQRKLSELSESLDTLARRKTAAETEEDAVKRAIEETLLDMGRCKSQIETGVLEATDKRVKIE